MARTTSTRARARPVTGPDRRGSAGGRRSARPTRSGGTGAAVGTAVAPAGRRVPIWTQVASLVLSLVAVGIGSYLTVTHYADPAALACPDTGIVNCTLVTTSSWSVVAGVPLAVLGLAWASVMAALTVPWAWRARAVWVGRARLVLSGAGAAMVLYLIYVELFRIGAICLWCTAMHVTALALFGVVLAGAGVRGTSTESLVR